jgi:acetyltransferase
MRRAALESSATDANSGFARRSLEIDGPVDEAQAKEILRGLGFSTPPSVVCANQDNVRRAFEKLSHPVVLKVLDASIIHKTEVDGVHVDIGTVEQLEVALAAIDDIGDSRECRRYLVEEMADPGIDLILGAKNDPVFGPTVLLGLGGTAVEALGDVVLRLAPVSRLEAGSMLSDLRCAELLDGWRGADPIDKNALIDGLVCLSRLIDENPVISVIDLNPVRVNASGAIVLDAYIECAGPDLPASGS